MNKSQNKLAFLRKLRYGGVAVALTVVVIAAVVIANLVFSAFAYPNNWYIDLTENKVYGLTEEGRELLDGVGADITIHFCAPYDTLEGDYYMKMVYELVKEIASEYENITYDYIDIDKNPAAVIKYKSATATAITESNIIVENNDTNQHRVYTLTNMFTFDSNGSSNLPWAFDGEMKLVSAIVQLTQMETPIVYFTYTHGERYSNSLYELFDNAGYELRTIDLSKEEIDERARMLVISNPLYDFEGISEDTAGRKSEIEKIDDFLERFGNVMVFISPESGELPELEELLCEWGIEFESAQLRDPENSTDRDGKALVGVYSLEKTMGGNLVEDIVSTGTPPKTIVRNARPIKLLYENDENRQTSTAIYTSRAAEKYVDGQLQEKGQYSLAVISREVRYIDNIAHYSTVLAVGSSDFILDDYLKSTYGNSDIIYTFMKYTGKTQVPVDLDFKPFEETALGITTAEATRWTIVIAAVIPAVVLIFGIVVWIRRKHA